MRWIAFILMLMPVVAAADIWTTDNPSQKERVFEIIRKGEKISEWSTPDTHDLRMLIDFKKELYVCTVNQFSTVKIGAMKIFCYDANE